MKTKNEYVPRVNQIDAIHLNKDIVRLIRENLLENLQAISPVLFSKIQPEIDLLIQSAIWVGSIGKQCSSFGQQLLVLSYDSEKLTLSRLCLHFILTVLPSYIKKLNERHSMQKEWLNKFLECGGNIALVLNVLNFFRFIKTGRKPKLVDYILGLDYISLRNNQRRDIGYKYLTRELIWGGFMEILGLVLPIINFRKIKRLYKRVLFGPNSYEMTAQRSIKLTPNSTCVFCGERPTLPHHIGCGHVYCYYCIAANILTDSNFNCIVCGTVYTTNALKEVA